MPVAASRYVASIFMEMFSECLRIGIHNNDLSVDEVAIICLVASESTRELRTDPLVLRKFASEAAAIPDEARPAVSLKFIYTSLGMSRETTRRRINGLVARGFLRRSRRGFYFPAQAGDADYTLEIRSFLVRRLEELDTCLARLPD